MSASTPLATPRRRVGLPGRRGEAFAGYLFIAVPMALFLVLNVGSILYAIYISGWKWNLRTGPVFVRWASELHGRPGRSDLPASDHQYRLLRRRLGPLDDGDRALPGRRRQPEAPRPDVLPGRLLLP